MQALAYGPRVVSKGVPFDPNDQSSFTISIPQGAKLFIKQAVDEYKLTNQVADGELALLDKFLANLASATTPSAVFGATLNAPKAEEKVEKEPQPDLIDEVTDAPQLFEFEDIAHSGHLQMKQIELVETKKKKKKKDEWQTEYFILLTTKHLIHFKPNTGFVDPFKKTISGKAIDLMQAKVALYEGPEQGATNKDGTIADDEIFEIRTPRHLYLLQPRGDDSSTPISATGWVERITEVMLAADEDDDMPSGQDRDYNDFISGYNEVVPDMPAGAGPPVISPLAA